jgi:membrane associated rhomboid family serine protease
VWRLFTAPLVHSTTGAVGHIVGAVLGLYFLSPSLEARWGSARFARFLVIAALGSYLFQMLFGLLLPSVGAKLVPDLWFGAIPVVSAISIAWACHHRDGQILLFMVLPVSGRLLIWVTIGFNVLAVIALDVPPHGRIAPFGAMGLGWLLGGSTPSPLRRWWLARKLSRLDAQAKNERQARSERVQKSALRVIRGGAERDPESERDPKKWLN